VTINVNNTGSRVEELPISVHCTMSSTVTASDNQGYRLAKKQVYKLGRTTPFRKPFLHSASTFRRNPGIRLISRPLRSVPRSEILSLIKKNKIFKSASFNCSPK
jgi:hypothetical protein